MPKPTISTRIRNALRQVFKLKHHQGTEAAHKLLVGDEDARENEARRNFDASFACSGLVDVEGIRKAIMGLKRDK